MNVELSFESLCGEYETFLSQCQDALDHWNARSEHIRHRQLEGEDVGRELLRLQARFAKSYILLQRHIESCDHCQLALRMSRYMTEADARALATIAN